MSGGYDPPNQACAAAAACRSTRFLELHIGVWKHAAACRSIQFFEFMCLSAPALLARETFCLPHVSPVCFSCLVMNNIQSTVNTKHTTFPITTTAKPHDHCQRPTARTSCILSLVCEFNFP